MSSRFGTVLISVEMVMLPSKETRGRLAAGTVEVTEIDAECATACNTFLLCLEMGRNSKVSEPLEWQLADRSERGFSSSNSKINLSLWYLA